MDFFIKKIFDGKIDDLTHLQFQKFSRGIFKDRAILKIKNYNGKFSVNTGPEYAGEFIRFLAEKLEDKKTKVRGIVVSTRELNKELEFVDKKQFMGVKQYIIEKEMSGREILEVCNKFPTSFIGLSFGFDSNELKIKEKAPKSAKPSSKNKEELKADFCRLKTSDLDLINSLTFDCRKDFKELEISHNFIIEELVISDDLKKKFKDDFYKLRECAKRKGKIIRKIKVDGKEIITEKNFEA